MSIYRDYDPQIEPEGWTGQDGPEDPGWKVCSRCSTLLTDPQLADDEPEICAPCAGDDVAEDRHYGYRGGRWINEAEADDECPDVGWDR